MTPCTCNTEMGDTCPKCAPKPAPVVLTLDGDAFLWPSGRKAIWPIRHGTAWMARADYTDILPPCQEHPTAETAAKALGVLLPPRVGDRWGDLTPEQRAMVPVGSELGPVGDPEFSAFGNSLVAVPIDANDNRWAHVNPATRAASGPAIDSDATIYGLRRITRLGPAPTATPEPDRSGWPVLVKRSDDDGYDWPGGDLAIGNYDGTGNKWSAWRPGVDGKRIGFYPTARDAAEALGARLPDEVGEAHPSLLPRKPGTVPDPRDAEIVTLAREATELRETIEKQGEEIVRLTAALQRAKAANPAREHALALLDLAATENPALIHIAALLRL